MGYVEEHYDKHTGDPQTRDEVLSLDRDALFKFMSKCPAEPADYDDCLACFAFGVWQDRAAMRIEPPDEIELPEVPPHQRASVPLLVSPRQLELLNNAVLTYRSTTLRSPHYTSAQERRVDELDELWQLLQNADVDPMIPLLDLPVTVTGMGA